MKKLIFFGLVVLAFVMVLNINSANASSKKIISMGEKMSEINNDDNELEQEKYQDNENKLIIEETTIENIYGYFGRCVSNECDPDLSYDLTFEDVKNMIRYGMTFDEVIELIGKPQEDFGSGTIWFQWNLVDGTMFCLQFFRMNYMEPINQIHVKRLLLVS